MKKLSVLAIAIMLQGGAFAQTEKGNIMLNGDLGVNSDSRETKHEDNNGRIDKNSSMNMNVAVRGGYFLMDNLALGLVVGFQNNMFNSSTEYSNSTSSSSNVNNSNLISAGIFARYYMGEPGENKLRFFGEFNAMFGTGGGTTENKSVSTFTTITTNGKSDETRLDFNIRPGIAYFVSKRLALEASIGSLGFSSGTETTYYEEEKQTTITDTGFNLNFSLQTFSFGLTFFFGNSGD